MQIDRLDTDILVIGGGIAAYKSLELIRLLKQQGITVRCVCSPAATQFVTPLSVASLSGEKVYTDLFSLVDEAEMVQILGREFNLTPMPDLGGSQIDPSVVRYISIERAQQNACIPLFKIENKLVVAIANPLELMVLDEIEE